MQGFRGARVHLQGCIIFQALQAPAKLHLLHHLHLAGLLGCKGASARLHHLSSPASPGKASSAASSSSCRASGVQGCICKAASLSKSLQAPAKLHLLHHLHLAGLQGCKGVSARAFRCLAGCKDHSEHLLALQEHARAHIARRQPAGGGVLAPSVAAVKRRRDELISANGEW